MERVRTSDDVVYVSNIPAELQLAKMILAYLKFEYQTGASNRGATIHITPAQDIKFKQEVLEWEKAAIGIACSML